MKKGIRPGIPNNLNYRSIIMQKSEQYNEKQLFGRVKQKEMYPS